MSSDYTVEELVTIAQSFDRNCEYCSKEIRIVNRKLAFGARKYARAKLKHEKHE